MKSEGKGFPKSISLKTSTNSEIQCDITYDTTLEFCRLNLILFGIGSPEMTQARQIAPTTLDFAFCHFYPRTMLPTSFKCLPAFMLGTLACLT